MEGSGKVLDPESKSEERVEFSGVLQNLEILLTVEKEEPRIAVSSVKFHIQEDTFVVSTFGDLPLYKAHNFEEQIRQALFHQEGFISSQLADSLQKVERHLWTRFPSKYKLLED